MIECEKGGENTDSASGSNKIPPYGRPDNSQTIDDNKTSNRLCL